MKVLTRVQILYQNRGQGPNDRHTDDKAQTESIGGRTVHILVSKILLASGQKQ
jgi:hypothetical protein